MEKDHPAIVAEPSAAPLQAKNVDAENSSTQAKKIKDFFEKDGNVTDFIDQLALSDPSQFYDKSNHDALADNHKVLASILVQLQNEMAVKRKSYLEETQKRQHAEDLYRDLKLEVESYEKELSQEIEARQKMEKQCEIVNKKLAKLAEISGQIEQDKLGSLKQTVGSSNDAAAKDTLQKLEAIHGSIAKFDTLDDNNSIMESKSIESLITISSQTQTTKAEKSEQPVRNESNKEEAGSTAKQGAISHCIPHRFESHKVIAPVRCQMCKSMIWSGSTVHKCIYCKYNAHTQCYVNVPPNCGMKDLELLKMSMGTPQSIPNRPATPGKKLADSSKSSLANSTASTVMTLTGVFGTPLEKLAASEKTLVPFVVEGCLKAIEEFGLKEQGIYRVPGKKSEVDRLKVHFNYGRPNITTEAKTDVTVVAGVIKLYLRELPDPLVTYDVQSVLLAISENSQMSKRDKDLGFRDALKKLSESHYATLKRIIYHFVQIANNSGVNKMMASNLGVVFGPTIIRPKEDSDLFHMSHQIFLIENMIKKYGFFFENGVLPVEDDTGVRTVMEGSDAKPSNNNAQTVTVEAPILSPLQVNEPDDREITPRPSITRDARPQSLTETSRPTVDIDAEPPKAIDDSKVTEEFSDSQSELDASSIVQ